MNGGFDLFMGLKLNKRTTDRLERLAREHREKEEAANAKVVSKLLTNDAVTA